MVISGVVGLTAILALVGCDQGGTAETTAVAAKNTAEAPVQPASTAAGDTVAAAATLKAPDDRQTAASAAETLTNSESRTAAAKGLAASTLAVEPKVLDLGTIATGDTGIGIVKITNTSNQPIIVENFKASCGCTSGNLSPNTRLAAGESKEVEIRLKAPNNSAPVTKTGTFKVTGQEAVSMTVKAEAKAFVEASPLVIDARTGDKGVITLRATDGTPFRVTSMRPDVLTDFPTEKAEEFQIELPFDVWRDAGAPPKLAFFIDHPKSPAIHLTVRGTAEDIQVQREKLAGGKNIATPTGDPTDPPTLKSSPSRNEPISAASDFARLIKTGRGGDILEQVAMGSLPVESVDRNGTSLLSIAAREGALDLVEGLIDAGADLEAADRTGLTPLMNAVKEQRMDIVRTLLDAGADVNTRDRMNGTSMSWACGFATAAMVQELIDAGAEVDIPQDLTGFTPLTWAAGFGDPNVVPLLIKHGANINAEDLLEGAAPITHAARTGKAESIQFLVDAGADVNFRDRNGKTPLLAAASGAGGTLDKIQLLIQLGADVKAEDNRGENALDFARKRTDLLAAGVTKFFEEQLGEAADEAHASTGGDAPASNGGSNNNNDAGGEG